MCSGITLAFLCTDVGGGGGGSYEIKVSCSHHYQPNE